ncbi:Uncharacterised protein [Mycobacteroides abscessus subsp. massiliense]|uniref:Uncharacterized protein n=1 Tax=Mycobacteroides abscessus TaxID=36809 RepID=A0A0U0ZPK1_9MYCO|nr:Uncharacterised protein [Mycobacteroides abscessus]SKU35562.1 Uncharacterised protein [Mycobacteroides abscessus subsp. massiliense]SKU40104.1 Uncharacterised protein [Mycobacteroides abscessus subsp. massiliense]SKU62541.1 Uncharacterised protein [Mycobacteroides abscessus subsp. massiliense]
MKRKGWPVKLSVTVALVIIVVVGAFDIWLWKHYHSSGATLVAVGALGVACFAQFQASRSAHNSAKASTLAHSAEAQAQANEERAKYGWTITVHPEGDRYVLRNTGTLAAHDVRFINVDPHTMLRFEQHEGEDGPTVERGHAIAFHAHFTYGSSSNAVELDWLPAGETERKNFKDVLDDIPNKTFDEMVKRRDVERDAEAAMDRAWCAEMRKILIDLAAAWGEYKTNDTSQNKMRVQGLVSALPSNMVRAMGFEVDVPRDFWGMHQWPFENFVQDEKDKKLVRENAPMIELMWNLTWVQIPRRRESDLSQPPEPWYRLEHAIHGYIELVRNREQGKVDYRDGQRDRESHERALQLLKQHQATFAKQKPQGEQNESPASSGN